MFVSFHSSQLMGLTPHLFSTFRETMADYISPKNQVVRDASDWTGHPLRTGSFFPGRTPRSAEKMRSLYVQF